MQAGKLMTKPYIPLLKEGNNVRTGFFERAQFESFVAHLPEPSRAVVQFAISPAGASRAKSKRSNGVRLTSWAGRSASTQDTTKNDEGRFFR